MNKHGGVSPLRQTKNRLFEAYGMRKRPSLILLDDDAIFSILLQTAGRKLGIRVCCTSNISDFSQAASKNRFDLMICDYQLGNTDAVSLGLELPQNMPILLVSHNARWIPDASEWPRPIQQFIPKKLGVFKILEDALRLAYKEKEKAS